MKKFSVSFLLISLITGFSAAQIQIESLDLKTFQTTTKPSILYTWSVPLLNGEIDTFKPESFYFKNPQLNPGYILPISTTGPRLIVQIDSCTYNLGINSSYRVDCDWIQSITVLKQGSAKELYGIVGEDGIAVIRLYKNHEDDFLNGKIATTPLRIKQIN